MTIISFSYSSGSGTSCCYADQYSDGKDCQSCLDGANCSFVGSTLATLQLEPGDWRASLDTTDARECWLAEACVGINNLSTTTNVTAATRRTTDTANIGQDNSNDVSDIYCAAGYKGPCKYIQIAIFVICVSVLI
jgi:hypothetical protein